MKRSNQSIESRGLTFSYSCAAGCGEVTKSAQKPVRMNSGQWPKLRCVACGKVGENWTGPMPTLWKETERVWVW